MKGLSVVITIMLFVVAHQMALRMKRAGLLPAESRFNGSSSISAPVSDSSLPTLATYSPSSSK